jgi:DNA-binding MarR family transcriptional regulator
MIKARQKELTPYQITPQQGDILGFLYNLGHKASLNELAAHTGRGINTISTQMTRMENDGLVRKERETPKSTRLSFELTGKGMDIHKSVRKIRSVKTIMSALSEEERQQLISLLQRIIDKADKFK